MVEKKRNLFRPESLERLSSPERLDRLMQVVSPKDWIALTSLGTLVFLALVWSIFGRIPITVTGRGVLTNPGRIVDLQSPVSGQLQKLQVKVGDCISKETVLAEIAQPELQKQLQLRETKLTELQQQDRQLNNLTQERTDLEKQAIALQRQTLKQRQQDAKDLATVLQDREIKAIEKQRQTLQQRLQNARDLSPNLEKRLNTRRDLKTLGAISDDVVLDAERSYRDNLNQISDLQAQLQELDVREIKANESYRQSQSLFSDLQAQAQELDTKEKTLAQQNLEATTTRLNQIQELKREIAQQKLQLQNNSQIRSPHSGCILEITATAGSVVTSGSSLGSIDTQDSTSQMVSLAYFPVKDGKQIKPGMTIQITPDTVKRERFGGILGRVARVSAFPVTKQGAAAVIGNPEVTQAIVAPGGAIEVLAQIKKDPSNFSGYKWSSSSGPQLQISPGITTTARVTVEERAPITFILPFLRSTSGAY